MDVFQTPGAFSWSDLMCPDPARAAEFYARLFGWAVDTMPMPGEPSATYRVLKVGEVAVAGLMATPQAHIPPHWASYVTVADVDATVALAQSLGATVLMPPMEVPGVGRIATLQDPQGAVINVITYSMPAQA